MYMDTLTFSISAPWKSVSIIHKRCPFISVLPFPSYETNLTQQANYLLNPLGVYVLEIVCNMGRDWVPLIYRRLDKNTI